MSSLMNSDDVTRFDSVIEYAFAEWTDQSARLPASPLMMVSRSRQSSLSHP